MELSERQLQYERQVIANFLLLRKALAQYQIWGARACASEELRRDPQFGLGIGAILQVVDTCSKYFQELQPPCDNAAEAFSFLTVMGKELKEYSDCLSALVMPLHREAIEWHVARLAALSKSIKDSYRQFFLVYEEKYPGRLNDALDTLREDELKKESL